MLGEDASADRRTASRHPPAPRPAAEALEKRIERIKTWPVTGGLVGQSLVIVISVVTGLVSRVVMNAIGLWTTVIDPAAPSWRR